MWRKWEKKSTTSIHNNFWTFFCQHRPVLTFFVLILSPDNILTAFVLKSWFWHLGSSGVKVEDFVCATLCWSVPKEQPPIVACFYSFLSLLLAIFSIPASFSWFSLTKQMLFAPDNILTHSRTNFDHLFNTIFFFLVQFDKTNCTCYWQYSHSQ